VRFGQVTLEAAELLQINADLGQLEVALGDWQRVPSA